MFLLTLITLLNAFVNNKTFVLENRFSIAGMPINVFDALIGLGLVTLLFRPKGRRFQADYVHPTFKWILLLFAIGTLTGFLGGFSNGADFQTKITIARSYLALPFSIILGYCYLNTPRSAKWFPYVHVIGGTVTALMILLFFVGASELNAASSNVNLLRTVDYVSPYAGIAAVFLIFTIVAGIKFLPKALTIALAGFTLVGQFATLSRSEWVSSVSAMGCMFLLLPKGARFVSMVKAVLMIMLMAFPLYFGVQLASRAAGWDFAGKVEKKLVSLLPGSRDGITAEETGKAWDSRLPAVVRELQMWTENPILGAGFGAQVHEERVAGRTMGFYHNAWTSTLAGTGLPGFIAMALTCGCCIVVGRRLVLERMDRASALLGSLAALSGVFFIVYGLSTLSINSLRGAIPLGLICGMVLRCRAMQQTMARQYAGYLPDPQQQQGASQWAPLLDESGGLAHPAF